VPLEISNRGVVDPRQSRRQPAQPSSAPALTGCSHSVLMARKSEAETTALVEAEKPLPAVEAMCVRLCARL
jgi:hypothetical protein